MQKQGQRSWTLKRKRRSSEESSNNENRPCREEKKFKGDSEATSSFVDGGRAPLTELAIPQEPFSRRASDIQGLEALSILPDSPADSLPPTPKGTKEDYCPLPKLNWAEETGLWAYLGRKDYESLKGRSNLYFDQHTTLVPRMRSVLLEWIIEVCEVYKLHRETYYVAIDYLDKYLTIAKNIPKSELQLIGVTCLLIASKVEEVYPPKVCEFAYVTDGACSEEEILKMELSILIALEWNCKVVSANGWLSLFLQLYCMKCSKKEGDLMYPQFNSKSFDQIAQLLDLVSLDINFLRYSYKVIAASVFYVVCSKSMLHPVTGYKYTDISDCAKWVDAFWEAIQDDKSTLEPPSFKPLQGGGRHKEFSFAVLKHSVSIELLEAAQGILYIKSDLDTSVVLTPPSSSKKHS